MPCSASHMPIGPHQSTFFPSARSRTPMQLRYPRASTKQYSCPSMSWTITTSSLCGCSFTGPWRIVPCPADLTLPAMAVGAPSSVSVAKRPEASLWSSGCRGDSDEERRVKLRQGVGKRALLEATTQTGVGAKDHSAGQGARTVPFGSSTSSTAVPLGSKVIMTLRMRFTLLAQF